MSDVGLGSDSDSDRNPDLGSNRVVHQTESEAEMAAVRALTLVAIVTNENGSQRTSSLPAGCDHDGGVARHVDDERLQ